MAYVPQEIGIKKRPGVNQAEGFTVWVFLWVVQIVLFVAVQYMD